MRERDFRGRARSLLRFRQGGDRLGICDAFGFSLFARKLGAAGRRFEIGGALALGLRLGDFGAVFFVRLNVPRRGVDRCVAPLAGAGVAPVAGFGMTPSARASSKLTTWILSASAC